MTETVYTYRLVRIQHETITKSWEFTTMAAAIRFSKAVHASYLGVGTSGFDKDTGHFTLATPTEAITEFWIYRCQATTGKAEQHNSPADLSAARETAAHNVVMCALMWRDAPGSNSNDALMAALRRYDEANDEYQDAQPCQR